MRSHQQQTDARQTWPISAAIECDRIPAGDSTDVATERTIRMMAEYIRFGAVDPAIEATAEYAARHFSFGEDRSPASLAWAVFWYVKHCIKFRLDEATMFRVGLRDEHDFLTAPSVLVRMKDPSEDCDGFTMLTAAMLSSLGIPVYIVTVAANAGEPQRWSHVFVVAIVDGQVMPLDTSHGIGPGWMVPRSRIFRLQAWNLDGDPVNDIAISSFGGLHGLYGSGRGMGDGDTGTDDGSGGTDLSNLPVTTLPILLPTVTTPAPAAGCAPGMIQVGSNCFNPSNPNNSIVGSGATSSGSGLDLTSLFNSLFGNAAAVAKVATQPTTSITLPNGTVVNGVTSSQAASLLGPTSLTSLMPILGIALIGLVAISFMGSKK
jgi:hypothetical protein